MGSTPLSSFAPSFTHRSILAIASVERPWLAPWGMRGVSSPLIRKTSELSFGFPGETTVWSAVPFMELLERRQIQLALLTPTPSPLWQRIQLATRIGATSCENVNRSLSPPLVFVVFPVESVFLFASFSAGRSFLRAGFALGAPRHGTVVSGKLAQKVRQVRTTRVLTAVILAL